MPDNDKRDWLAFDWLKQKTITGLLEMLDQRVDEDRSVELQNYVSTFLARWGL